MRKDTTDASGASDRDCRGLSTALLAAYCLEELGRYQRREPSTEHYGLELFRRATVEGSEEAWSWVQHSFSVVVRSWLHRHPSRDTACRLESEENYIAQAFERFWRATASTHHIEFTTMAAALQYLRASLNGAILDTLRAYSRPEIVSFPEAEEQGEPCMEDQFDSSDVWDVLQTMLIGQREQRLAYLLYYCGLKPREIVRFCPVEWNDVREIYRLRRNIMDRLLRNSDRFR